MIPEIPSQSHILEILHVIPFSLLMFSFEDLTHLLYTPCPPRHCEPTHGLSQASVPEQCGRGTTGAAELLCWVQAVFLRVLQCHSHLS